MTFGAAATAAQLGGLPALLPALLLVSVAAIIAISAALASDSDGLGPADLVTGLRLGMAIGIGSAALFAAPKPALVTALLLTALATDALDGWLARGSGTASSFGARFDLETDTVLLAAASLHAAAFAGALVLVAPLLRPAWIISCRFLPWLDRPLPPSRRRQTLCALPIFLLILVPWPLGGSVWATPMGLTAALLLFVSFAIDVVHQWLRPAASSPA